MRRDFSLREYTRAANASATADPFAAFLLVAAGRPRARRGARGPRCSVSCWLRSSVTLLFRSWAPSAFTPSAESQHNRLAGRSSPARRWSHQLQHRCHADASDQHGPLVREERCGRQYHCAENNRFNDSLLARAGRSRRRARRHPEDSRRPGGSDDRGRRHREPRSATDRSRQPTDLQIPARIRSISPLTRWWASASSTRTSHGGAAPSIDADKPALAHRHGRLRRHIRHAGARRGVRHLVGLHPSVRAAQSS